MSLTFKEVFYGGGFRHCHATFATCLYGQAFYLIGVLLLLASCGDKAHSVQKASEISLGPRGNVAVDTTDVFNEHEILHGRISYFDMQDGKRLVYYYDNSLNSINVLDENLALLDSIENYGSGPCEYRSIIDMIIQDNYAIILDYAQYKILVYNMEDAGRLNSCTEYFLDKNMPEPRRLVRYNVWNKSVFLIGYDGDSLMYHIELTENSWNVVDKITMPVGYVGDRAMRATAQLAEYIYYDDVLWILPTYYSGTVFELNSMSGKFKEWNFHDELGNPFHVGHERIENPDFARFGAGIFGRYLTLGRGVVRQGSKLLYVYMNRQSKVCPQSCLLVDVINPITKKYETTHILYEGHHEGVPPIYDLRSSDAEGGFYFYSRLGNVVRRGGINLGKSDP